MYKQYSIAEARNHFAALVHELEPARPVQVTRRGKVVAVLMSIEEYERLTTNVTDFWDALDNFRATVDLPPLQIEPEIFHDLRITDWQT
jgi:prevent-host-death family protein